MYHSNSTRSATVLVSALLLITAMMIPAAADGLKADFIASPLIGQVPLDVQFTDQSIGCVTSYLWYFGDGFSTNLKDPLHQYVTAGNYTVSLVVANASGSNWTEKENYIHVTPPPPVADFSASPTSGVAPLPVNFTDLSTGNPTEWAWDFGDGTANETGQNPGHTYANPGLYNVTLTAGNMYGNHSVVKQHYINATEPVPPVAAFTGSPTSGPAPLSVSFTDQSTGTVTSHLWSFGDGGNSTAASPSHVYSLPGTYNVTLTVNNSLYGDTLTKSGYIAVTNPPPVASFSANRTAGNPPLHVQFTDTSSGENITSRSWDFGDSSSGTGTDPVHVYQNPGLYSVSLTVENDGGQDTVTKTEYIRVFQSIPVAEFIAEPTSGGAPLSVQFHDTSLGNPTTFMWQFGDGASSTMQSPEHTYMSPGTYTVSLAAGTSGGTNTTIKEGFIQVSQLVPMAAFNATPRLGAVPFQVNFSDLSTGSPATWSWDFGDNTSSSLQNPAHTYTSAGVYTVNLTVTNAHGSDTASGPGYIEAMELPVANFTAYTNNGSFSAWADFYDMSTGSPTSWNWSFGDGDYSEYQNPWHYYSGVGSYSVTLTVNNAVGSDTITKEDFIVVPTPPPFADFYGSPRFGTFPLTVQFEDYSSGSIDWDTPPATYEWDFGDGTPNSTERGTVYHNYMNAGTYTVTLTVTDIGGSDTLTYVNYIGNTTPPEPIADFTATPKHGYAPLTVDFIDQSVGSPPLSYAWAFGDGNISTLKDASYIYTTPGLYNITHVTTNNGGSDAVTKYGYIEVLPAPSTLYAEFTATPRSGASPLTVDFIDQSGGAIDSWAWSFGDSATSSEKNPSHVYSAPGSYTISLTVTGAEGSSSEEKDGYIQVGEVTPLTAEFTSNVTAGTVPLTVQFLDASQGSPSSWSWYFESGYYYLESEGVNSAVLPPYNSHVSAEKNPVVVYNNPGNYTVMLTVSRTGETDTIEKAGYIQVIPPPPVADFYVYNGEGPAPLMVEFDAYIPYWYYVTEWDWTFGDGTAETTTSPWIQHSYLDPGLYNVTLTVTSPYGSDTITRENCVNVTQPLPPVPSFGAAPLSGNAPLSVSFTDTSGGIVTSRFWDFGDGASEWQNASAGVTHSYALPGSYTVSLTVGNSGGQATEEKPDLITVNPFGPPPDANFRYAPNIGYAPLTVSFTDLSLGSPLKWEWDFGDGSGSSLQNPTHTYTDTGKYVVTLKVYNGGGSDTRSATVWARPRSAPIAYFMTDRTFGLAPLTVHFTDRSINNPTSWSWNFGDGATSTIQNPAHTYSAPGTYTAKLTVQNSGGSSSSTRRIYVR